jgi:hypothetical protein
MIVQKVVFDSFLETRELPEGIFQLTQDFHVSIKVEGEWHGCVVPKDFTTDFASVPRLPLAYGLFGGKYNRSGTVHDALYSAWHQIRVFHKNTREDLELSRSFADDVLFQALRAEGAFWITARLMYRGVRLFGGVFYKRKGKV